MQPTLVIRVDPERRQWWKETLQGLLPELNIVLWDEDTYDPGDVRYAVVWNPPLGGLAKLPKLECVLSVGAGVAHILRDPSYPRAVPIIRTVSDSLRMRMTEYVVLHVLRYHRRLPEIVAAQQNRQWVQYVESLARDVNVGILGVGNLGIAAARGLATLGYGVAGWSRRGRPIDGIRVHSGGEGLRELLQTTNILVCMLPQTPATENILNKSTFSGLPQGAALINVGRGEHLVEEDLLDALDAGHLRGATLDVFRDEPLPSASPLWSHPRILITSHTASAIEPSVGGKVIADNLLAFIRGEPVNDIVDIEQGY
jgi:glyoxylate/hydroxypyruvate reductase A